MDDTLTHKSITVKGIRESTVFLLIWLFIVIVFPAAQLFTGWYIEVGMSRVLLDAGLIIAVSPLLSLFVGIAVTGAFRDQINTNWTFDRSGISAHRDGIETVYSIVWNDVEKLETADGWVVVELREPSRRIKIMTKQNEAILALWKKIVAELDRDTSLGKETPKSSTVRSERKRPQFIRFVTVCLASFAILGSAVLCLTFDRPLLGPAIRRNGYIHQTTYESTMKMLHDGGGLDGEPVPEITKQVYYLGTLRIFRYMVLALLVIVVLVVEVCDRNRNRAALIHGAILMSTLLMAIYLLYALMMPCMSIIDRLGGG